jgi:hypothetical protein
VATGSLLACSEPADARAVRGAKLYVLPRGAIITIGQRSTDGQDRDDVSDVRVVAGTSGSQIHSVPPLRGFFVRLAPLSRNTWYYAASGTRASWTLGFPRLATRAMISQLPSTHSVVTIFESCGYADDKPQYRVETRDRAVPEETRASRCRLTVRHPDPERSRGHIFRETE